MTDLLEQYSELSKILHKLNQARSARYQALKSAFKPAEASDKPAPFAARWAPELSGLASGKRLLPKREAREHFRIVGAQVFAEQLQVQRADGVLDGGLTRGQCGDDADAAPLQAARLPRLLVGDLGGAGGKVSEGRRRQQRWQSKYVCVSGVGR